MRRSTGPTSYHGTAHTHIHTYTHGLVVYSMQKKYACVRYLHSRITVYHSCKIDLRYCKALHSCVTCSLLQKVGLPCAAIHYGLCTAVTGPLPGKTPAPVQTFVPNSSKTPIPVSTLGGIHIGTYNTGVKSAGSGKLVGVGNAKTPVLVSKAGLNSDVPEHDVSVSAVDGEVCPAFPVQLDQQVFLCTDVECALCSRMLQNVRWTEYYSAVCVLRCLVELITMYDLFESCL